MAITLDESLASVTSADGRTLLVGNMVERDLWVFESSGSALRDTGHRIKVKGGSAAVRTAEK